MKVTKFLSGIRDVALGRAHYIRLSIDDGMEKRRIRFFVERGENLLDAIRKNVPGVRVEIDGKYGMEITSIGNTGKVEGRAGWHFFINGKIPFAPDGSRRLYLSPYHIDISKSMNIRLEMVSNCEDFEGSVIDPKLDFRTFRFELEPVSAEARLSASRIWNANYSLYYGSAGLRLFLEFEKNMRILRKKERDSIASFAFASNVREEAVWLPPTISSNGTGFIFKNGRADDLRVFTRFENVAPGNGGFESAWDESGNSHDSGQWAPGRDNRADRVLEYGFEGNLGDWAFGKSASMDDAACGAPSGCDSAVKAFQDSVPLAEAALVGEREPLGKREAAQERGVVLQLPVQSKARQKGAVAKAVGAREFVALSSMSRFKAVIFDLDGVVVDSEAPHMRTFNELFAPYGVKIGEQYWKKRYTGIGSHAIVQDLLERHSIPGTVEEWVGKRREAYQEYVEDKGLAPMPGFLRLYQELKKRKIKVIVASGGHKTHVKASLKSIGVPEMKFVGVEDVKKSKPSPDLFIEAAKRLGAKPDECLVFEDSLAGMKAAFLAGMPCVAVATTLKKKAVKGKAAVVVENLRSPLLRKILAGLFKRR